MLSVFCLNNFHLFCKHSIKINEYSRGQIQLIVLKKNIKEPLFCESNYQSKFCSLNNCTDFIKLHCIELASFLSKIFFTTFLGNGKFKRRFEKVDSLVHLKINQQCYIFLLWKNERNCYSLQSSFTTFCENDYEKWWK